MKAAIYARFSTEKQSEASIEDQNRECERIADREQLQVVARYQDQAISGGTTNRPGYQALLHAARRREFGVIIAEDSSRLWRELSEQWRALNELQDLGIHVVGHGIDTRRDESKLLLAVSGAMAEAFRDEISRRTRRGLEGRARAGMATGGRAFGYVSARDSGTGMVEIDETQAAIVRRIFEMYADGASPRSIAATLNDEAVPSPGSQWNRTSRRTAGWLASAIHGDASRGTGILNNRRYIGVVAWGRSTWRRGAADSSKRHMAMAGKPLAESRQERLRIVSDELWGRVKRRQSLQSQTLGARVKGALRRRAAGGGRPARYILSGLLRCGICGARFVLSNGERYQCSSHVNGRACANVLSVKRALVETKVLDSLKDDLSNPEVVQDAEQRLRTKISNREPPADNRARIDELQREVGNLIDAIAQGLLRTSPALAQRLAAAEAELGRLRAAATAASVPTTQTMPDVPEQFRRLVADLKGAVARGEPERARAAVMQAVGSEIVLTPHESGRHLTADYDLQVVQLLATATGSEFMVAGAGFEPATFGL